MANVINQDEERLLAGHLKPVMSWLAAGMLSLLWCTFLLNNGSDKEEELPSRLQTSGHIKWIGRPRWTLIIDDNTTLHKRYCRSKRKRRGTAWGRGCKTFPISFQPGAVTSSDPTAGRRGAICSSVPPCLAGSWHPAPETSSGLDTPAGSGWVEHS